MTFLQLQNAVMGRLNLTSAEARARVKARLNERYRQIQASLHLAPTRYGTITFTTASGDETVTASGVAKIFNVYDPTTLKRPLDETTLLQIRERDAGAEWVGTPQQYAISEHIDDVIVLELRPIPTATASLKSDALLAGTDMSGDGDVPTIPVDFHDALEYGAVADELDKVEKKLADKFEAKFEKRLRELRYFIAKSAYLSQRQTDHEGAVLAGYRMWPYSYLP